MGLNLCDADGDEETLHLRVEADHEVEDGGEHDRSDDKDGKLGQLLAQKVHICPVHSIKMLSKKYW